MGRKKVVLKRIEDKSSRQVTFSKRRAGLMKKARELSILCDVQVGVVIFSSRGKLYHFSSANTSPASIISRYWSQSEAKNTISNDVDDEESYCGKFAKMKSYTELLQVVQRYLEVPFTEQLTVTDLVQLEKQLDATLAQTRARKMELMLNCVKTLRDKESSLGEENRRLEAQIAAMKNGSETYELVIGSNNHSPHNLVCASQVPTLNLLK